MKNKNTIIIFSLIAICLLVLNYDNISSFFTLKEGVDASSNDVIEAQKLTLENERDDLIEQLLTSEQSNDEITKIPLKEFLNDTRKDLLKDIAKKNFELQFLNKSYDDIKSEKETNKDTYKNHKGSMMLTIGLAIMLTDIKILEDMGLDLYGIIDEIKSEEPPSRNEIAGIASTTLGINGLMGD